MGVPVVVVTHEIPTDWVETHPEAPFHFVTDGFDAALTVPAFQMPSQLGATRTTGIGSVPSRFMAGAVTDATLAGGTLVELSDTNLTVGASHAFTA